MNRHCTNSGINRPYTGLFSTVKRHCRRLHIRADTPSGRAYAEREAAAATQAALAAAQQAVDASPILRVPPAPRTPLQVAQAAVNAPPAAPPVVVPYKSMSRSSFKRTTQHATQNLLGGRGTIEPHDGVRGRVGAGWQSQAAKRSSGFPGGEHLTNPADPREADQSRRQPCHRCDMHSKEYDNDETLPTRAPAGYRLRYTYSR